MNKKLNTFIAMLYASAFANPGWKLDADGKIEMKDGNPVWVDANGNEAVMQGDTISTLRREAQQHRETAGTALEKLKKYEVNGKLVDPEIAIKAIDTVSKLDAKKLIDAGEVDKVREQVSQQFITTINEKDAAYKNLQGQYEKSQIDYAFAGSDFIRERVAIPRDMFESSMRNNFKFEDGKITAYDRSGNRLMSKKNPGDYADPSEAMELLVEMHPQKDMILKANDANGSGNNGNGGNRGGGRTIRTADFDKLPPQQQAEYAKKAGAGEIQIVD